MDALAGWAQALVSAAAIIASGFIATYSINHQRKLARLDDNRRRLDITTIVWPPSGLQLNFNYLPEFNHIGLRARVKLVSPEGATLKELRHRANPAPVGDNYTQFEPGGVFIGDGAVRLVGTQAGQPFTGGILIVPPAGNHEPLRCARILVEVETNAGEALLRHELTVGPIEQVEAHWNGVANL